jgi:hypothetical protein
MNIFHLHEDPIQCAKWHLDKHVVKMPTEYAQLLSTAHRMLDGDMYLEKRTYPDGRVRNVKRWKMPDDREDNIFHAGHYGHPSAVWVRESKANYNMLFRLYTALLSEYDYRYNEEGKKVHGASLPWIWLMRAPKNIPDIGLTEIPPAMKEFPQCIVKGDPIQSYRNFYNVAKKGFATWKKRPIPEWYVAA